MIIVGLTGGIGSGKSSVAEMFKDEGAYVIDFDYLSRVVMEPDTPAWRDIVEHFGPEILLPDRTLNRSRLAEIVFSDAQSRKALEGFTHPRIFEKRDTLLKDIEKKNPNAIVIVDVPLLFELSLNKDFDKVIKGCPVPVVIAGGPKCKNELEVLEFIYDGMQKGAIGINLGRNVWQNAHPVAMAKALQSIVHEKATAKEAYQIFKEIKDSKKV